MTSVGLIVHIGKNQTRTKNLFVVCVPGKMKTDIEIFSIERGGRDVFAGYTYCSFHILAFMHLLGQHPLTSVETSDDLTVCFEVLLFRSSLD